MKKLIKQKKKQTEYLGKCLDTELPYDNLLGIWGRLWYSWHMETGVEKQQEKAVGAMCRCCKVWIRKETTSLWYLWHSWKPDRFSQLRF